jgi:hypothetical protein
VRAQEAQQGLLTLLCFTHLPPHHHHHHTPHTTTTHHTTTMPLQGTLNKATGEINLEFAAEFKFTAGSIYTAAPLVVETTLTTDSSSGLIHSSNGSRLSGTAARWAPAAGPHAPVMEQPPCVCCS